MSPHISPYLPVPPRTSPYLPISPRISPYLPVSPRRYELISTLVSHMEQLGWGPYQADHEDANGPDRDRRGGSSVRARGTEQCRPFRTGQFEINWDFDDALARVPERP